MRQRTSWLHRHGLSVALAVGIISFLTAYVKADPATHLGAFFGNAIADWLGAFVTVVATKFWYERGSMESRIPSRFRRVAPEWLHEHSLTLVLLLTWGVWIWWYAGIDPDGKTGQVVGNVVSEWSQILALVWFTKYLTERGSKESRSR